MANLTEVNFQTDIIAMAYEVTGEYLAVVTAFTCTVYSKTLQVQWERHFEHPICDVVIHRRVCVVFFVENARMTIRVFDTGNGEPRALTKNEGELEFTEKLSTPPMLPQVSGKGILHHHGESESTLLLYMRTPTGLNGFFIFPFRRLMININHLRNHRRVLQGDTYHSTRHNLIFFTSVKLPNDEGDTDQKPQIEVVSFQDWSFKPQPLKIKNKQVAGCTEEFLVCHEENTFYLHHLMNLATPVYSFTFNTISKVCSSPFGLMIFSLNGVGHLFDKNHRLEMTVSQNFSNCCVLEDVFVICNDDTRTLTLMKRATLLRKINRRLKA